MSTTDEALPNPGSLVEAYYALERDVREAPADLEMFDQLMQRLDDLMVRVGSVSLF